MKKIIYGIFYIFLLFPLLSMISYEFINVQITSIMFIVCSMVLFLFICMKLIKKSKLVIPNYLKFYILFLIYMTLADYISGNITNHGLARYFYTNHYITMLNVLIIIENYSFDRKFVNNIIIGLKLTIVVAAIISILQIENHDLWQSAYSLEHYDTGEFMFRNTAVFGYLGSGAVGVITPAILAILFSLSNIHNHKYVIYYILCAIIVLLYKSRWVMISFFIALSQNIKLDNKFLVRSAKFLILATIMFSITFVAAIALNVDINRYISERIMSSSTVSRVHSVHVFFQQFPKHFLLGTGNVLTNETRRALAGKSPIIHVGVLALFYNFGIIGGGIYCMYFVSLLKKLKRESIVSNFKALYFIILIFLISNLTLTDFDIFDYSVILGFILHKYYLERSLFQIEKKNIEPELQNA